MAREVYFENILALFIAVKYEKNSEMAFKYLDYFEIHGEMPKIALKSELTQDELEDIDALRKQGITWREIASILGLKSYSYIMRAYKKEYKH